MVKTVMTIAATMAQAVVVVVVVEEAVGMVVVVVVAVAVTVAAVATVTRTTTRTKATIMMKTVATTTKRTTRIRKPGRSRRKVKDQRDMATYVAGTKALVYSCQCLVAVYLQDKKQSRTPVGCPYCLTG